jgi:hypothetical protein
MSVSAAGTVLAFNVMSPKFADLAPGLAYALVLANQTGADITTGTFTFEGADASAGDPCVPGTFAPLQLSNDCSPAPAVATKKVNAAAIAAGGTGHAVGNKISLGNGVVLAVATVAAGVITGVTIDSAGSITGANPANPVAQVSSSGPGIGSTFNLTWVNAGDASITLSAQNPIKAGTQCAVAVECPKQFVRIFSQGATNLELLAVVTRLRRTGM